MNNFNDISNIFDTYILKTYSRFPISFVDSEDVYLIDSTGKKYIDFLSGLGVNNIGYSNKDVINAVTNQVNKIIHTSNLFYIEPQGLLAEKIVKLTFPGKMFFCNSGAEANEAALKFSKLYNVKKLNNTKKCILSATNSFHGRTMAALTATGQTKYQKNFSPLIPGFEYFKYNDIEDFKNKFNQYNPFAVIIEIVQGEGGIFGVNNDFILQAYKMIKDNNALIIIDEVQSGIYRTGKFCAYQHYNIKPDMITLAKGLAGGVPIGAVLVADNISDIVEPGEHASTFGGNFISTQTAISVLDYFNKVNIIDNVNHISKIIEDMINDFQNKNDIITDIRIKGLMVGISVSVDSKKVMKNALKNGLIINAIGNNIIRLLPPLTINENTTKQGLEILFNSILNAAD